MYKNVIFIYIFWYSKICWIPMKKYWFQLNSRGLSCDQYIFWVFFGYGITAKFHLYRICVTDFREGDLFGPPPSVSSPKINQSWIGLEWMNQEQMGKHTILDFRRATHHICVFDMVCAGAYKCNHTLFLFRIFETSYYLITIHFVNTQVHLQFCQK